MERPDCSRVGFGSSPVDHVTDHNSSGNYVELVEGDEGGSAPSAAQPSHMSIPTSAAAAAAVAAPAEPKGGAIATALYDYEAAGEFEPCPLRIQRD
jgi:hypothetical protein